MPGLLHVGDWPELPELPGAACKGTDNPEVFFPPAGHGGGTFFIERAKATCATCPSATACLQYALTHDVLGIWGGTTRPERKLLRDGASA